MHKIAYFYIEKKDGNNLFKIQNWMSGLWYGSQQHKF